MANAGKGLFILRLDSDSTMYNNALKAKLPTTRQDSNRFQVHTGRLMYMSQINEQLEVVGRIRFDGAFNNTPNSTDNLNDHLDIFQLTHKWNEMTKLTLGKMDQEILGNDGIPYGEIYLSTRARADAAVTHLYGTGAKLSMNFDKHDVSFMLFNQSEGTSANQTKYEYGIVHTSKSLEDSVFTKASYHKDHRQSLITDDLPTVEMIALGVKYYPKPYYVSLDYLTNTRTNMDGTGLTAIAAADKRTSVTSYMLDGGYQWDDPHLVRFRYDKNKKKSQDLALGTDSITDYEGITLAYEFKPFVNEKFRYHAVFTQLTEEPAGSDKLVTQHIILGALIVADIFK